jgi:1-deoxy-D-xylulose-5-phosphate reductoisomerase
VPKNIAIFGSTGSIGASTLEIVKENPKLFMVVTLVAGKNLEKLVQQIEEFKPKNVYIVSQTDAQVIKKKFKNVNVFFGEQGMIDISNLVDCDVAVSALVGIAGLRPTFNMIRNGKTVALANKEVLVTGGKIIMDAVREYGATVLTVDSEHSAIMQCLRGEEENQPEKILLTASGGPFLGREITNDITVDEALNHPTWSMGKKITIDSATMMNKGFEVIEASLLFNVPPEQIEVVIHRDSLIHSMVQFRDGTIMANIGPKSMQIPIAYALTYPQRIPNNIERLDLFEIGQLNFCRADMEKFKCLRLAFDCMKLGHSHQVVLNAANEVCVDAFLNGRIGFKDIGDIIEKVVKGHKGINLKTIDDIMKLDEIVKEETKKLLD